MEAFELLAAGTNPNTGEPFGHDITPVFDLYFAREIPNAGATLLAFVEGETYHTSARRAWRTRTGCTRDRVLASLDGREARQVSTPAGHAG